jgi:hypothetical protein
MIIIMCPYVTLIVWRCTKALEELGYIKQDKGFYNHENNYGRETRITAAPKLYMKIAKYEELKKPGCFKLKPPEKLIILRDNKEDITFKHTPETLMMEKDMKQYNQFVDDHKITIEFDRNTTITNGFITEDMMKNLYCGRMAIDQVLINKNQKYLNHPVLSYIDKPTQTDHYSFYPETDYLSENLQIKELISDDDHQFLYSSYPNLYSDLQPTSDYHYKYLLTELKPDGNGLQFCSISDYDPYDYTGFTRGTVPGAKPETVQGFRFSSMTKKDLENTDKDAENNVYHDPQVAEEMLLNLGSGLRYASRFLQSIDTSNKKKTEDKEKKYGYKSKNNRGFLDQEYLLGDCGVDYLSLELTYEYSYRVFGRGDETFQHNGRSYGPVHQNISKDLRKHIRINGEPTVELDFSSMHPRMLYHLEGIDYPENPYEACDGKYMKGTYKAAILVGINAEDKKEAMKAIYQKMVDKKLPWPHKENPLCYIMNKIGEVHKPIAHKICSDAGTKLMRLDSDIMNNILMSLMKKGICGLSVHDSVIVAERHRDTLYQVIMGEYKNIMGFYPVIG